MLEDKLLLPYKPISSNGKMLRIYPDLYSLNPKSDYKDEDFKHIQFSKDLLPPPANFYNRDHEVDVGDVFVAFAKTRKLERWTVGWDAEEKKRFGIYGVNYDCAIEVDPEITEQVIFNEVDRGTEDMDTLKEKCRKYIKLADANPHSPFLVVFTVQGRDGAPAKPRGERILKEVLAPLKRGNMFLATPHKAYLADPLGPVLIPPYDAGKLLSFSDL